MRQLQPAVFSSALSVICALVVVLITSNAGPRSLFSVVEYVVLFCPGLFFILALLPSLRPRVKPSEALFTTVITASLSFVLTMMALAWSAQIKQLFPFLIAFLGGAGGVGTVFVLNARCQFKVEDKTYPVVASAAALSQFIGFYSLKSSVIPKSLGLLSLPILWWLSVGVSLLALQHVLKRRAQPAVQADRP